MDTKQTIINSQKSLLEKVKRLPKFWFVKRYIKHLEHNLERLEYVDEDHLNDYVEHNPFFKYSVNKAKKRNK